MEIADRQTSISFYLEEAEVARLGRFIPSLDSLDWPELEWSRLAVPYRVIFVDAAYTYQQRSPCGLLRTGSVLLRA